LERDVYGRFFALETRNWWFAGMRAIFREQFRSLSIPLGARLVDVGCGTGIWTRELGRYGRTIGVDFAREALVHCRARKLTGLVQASGLQLPFRAESCAVVTAFGVVEHIEDDVGLLEEFARLVQPGGHVLLLTSAYRFLWSEHDDFVHHKRRYTRAELLEKLRKVGLEPRKLTHVNTVLFPAVAVGRAVQRMGFLKPGSAGETTDIFDVGPALNRVLLGVLKLESRWLRYWSFPFGVGLACVAQKPG
jgi:2-polyprenyl-3-methyl-5-hydroxy-6-metoxy-1,4-benzoquinol methylase